jgi:site-specific DNA-adenine methylase
VLYNHEFRDGSRIAGTRDFSEHSWNKVGISIKSKKPMIFVDPQMYFIITKKTEKNKGDNFFDHQSAHQSLLENLRTWRHISGV